MQLFLFLFPLQHMKRPALQNKQLGVLRMAFRARKVFGTLEKRATGERNEVTDVLKTLTNMFYTVAKRSLIERLKDIKCHTTGHC